jgi:tetratricopeptide (TPR) repeat protein
LTHVFGSKQISSPRDARQYQQVGSLPELSNAELERLFARLLEGVHQGRGQEWVLRYLQRIEIYVPTERWLDWLLMYGERLLTSPAPNHQVATRLVQLGELDIGIIGDISYDIGTQLLMQNPTTEHEENQVANDIGTATSTVTPTSNGQELIHNLSEQLWKYDEDEPQEITSTSPGQELIRNLGEQLWEHDEPEAQTRTSAPPNTPVDETLTDNSREYVLQHEAEDIQTTAANLLIPAKEDSITSLTELRWDYEEEVQTPSVSFVTHSNSTTEKAQTPSASFVTHSNSTTEEILDNSLANADPNVAYALDELWVRLDQSANLVQQIVTNLAVSTGNYPNVIEEHTHHLNRINQAQALFYQGLQQAKSGNLFEAIASYDLAVELQPDISEYWFNRGLTLFHLKRFTEAIASYNQAIELKPDYYKAWYKRGGTLGELGNFEEAIASFDQAIQIKPDEHEAWSSRGWAMLKLGWLSEAISSYEQALNLQPEDQENWYYRGIALAVSEQYTEAIASYDQALEIQPDYYEVWIDRGVVLFNLKQWSEAIASWDHALSIQSDFYLAWYNRGIALDNLGRREEAIASYRRAINIKPDFHLAWYNQATALFYLEQFTEAIACYDRAIEIKQDYWEAWISRGNTAGHVVDADTLLSLSSSIVKKNPALKQIGYAGKLASYEEGLKYLRSDTHPEGWGRLHFAIGNTYYEQGKKQPKPRDYWRKAVAGYHQALLTLTSEDFALLHLEILQCLVKTFVGLGQTTQVQELQQRGIDLLHQLLSETTRTDENKKQLALKFAGLNQLAVDLAVESGDLVEAWEIAEQGKNACLNLLLFGWNQEIYSPYYDAVQKLLNPTTAIVYWHISPVALQTFILKDQAPSPILLFTPIQDIGVISSEETVTRLHELPLPEAVRRLNKFEDWLEDWHQQYQEYRSNSQEQHSWRKDMEQKLLQLKKILNISTIAQELEGITQLILILHRDLYRLPIHVLFNLSSATGEDLLNRESDFNIIYLPSVQVGLSLKNERIWQWQNQFLLSVEYPKSRGYSQLEFAKFESEIISQMFNNVQQLTGSQATKNFVEKALSEDYNIFNFTGYVNNNLLEPEKTELVLTGEDKLTLEQICQNTLASYNLITLPACENSITNNYSISTEYVDLSTAFLSLGVPHVVSTLWIVESPANALVMIEFYRRLQQNQSLPTALTETTSWLKELTVEELRKWYEDLLNNLHLDNLEVQNYLEAQLYKTTKQQPNKKLYSHPYYWAAFTIAGKPN